MRPGTYSLYAFVPGVLGSFQSDRTVVVNESTSTLHVGNFSFKAPRQGPTLWEIGVPDRSAGALEIPEGLLSARVVIYTDGKIK